MFCRSCVFRWTWLQPWSVSVVISSVRQLCTLNKTILTRHNWLNSYVMTTFRCPSDILFTSCWLFTTRRCTWPRNHLVPCVAELVGSCIPIHACRGLPNPKCLSDPSGLSLCLPGDHFCTVPVDDVLLFHSKVSDDGLVSNTTVAGSGG